MEFEQLIRERKRIRGSLNKPVPPATSNEIIKTTNPFHLVSMDQTT